MCFLIILTLIFYMLFKMSQFDENERSLRNQSYSLTCNKNLHNLSSTDPHEVRTRQRLVSTRIKKSPEYKNFHSKKA